MTFGDIRFEIGRLSMDTVYDAFESHIGLFSYKYIAVVYITCASTGISLT